MLFYLCVCVCVAKLSFCVPIWVFHHLLASCLAFDSCSLARETALKEGTSRERERQRQRQRQRQRHTHTHTHARADKKNRLHCAKSHEVLDALHVTLSILAGSGVEVRVKDHNLQQVSRALARVD